MEQARREQSEGRAAERGGEPGGERGREEANTPTSSPYAKYATPYVCLPFLHTWQVWEGEGREADEAMQPDAAIVEARDALESCEVVECWHKSEPTDAPAVLPADDGATRGV
jgi:hypothetical protein